MKCKKRECPNYSTYCVLGHTFAVSAYISSLFLQLQKDRHSADFCLNFQTLEIQVAYEEGKLQKNAIKKYFW